MLPSLAAAVVTSVDVICSSSRPGDLTALRPDRWRGLTSPVSPRGKRERSCARSVRLSGKADGELGALCSRRPLGGCMRLWGWSFMCLSRGYTCRRS